MGKMKEESSSSQVNRKPIQRKSSDSIDHWAFLEEIEAPMWSDLTLEAQFMDKDIDDAWFRVSHPIHQTSSRQLKKSFQHFGKDKDSLHNLQCHSPKVPDSVSRSRGKHYKTRKWLGHVHGSWTSKQHPVRELGGKDLGTVTKKATSRNSSTSTITTSSSSRKPLQSLVDDNQNSIPESTITMEKGSSSSVASKCQNLRTKPSSGVSQNLRPKPSFGVTRNASTVKTKKGTSEVACKTSSMVCNPSMRDSRNTRYSTRVVTKSENLFQNRKSSAGKSSVGSSCSLGSILENVDSTKMLRNEKTKESKKPSGSVSKFHDTQIKVIAQCCKHQNRVDGAKFLRQQSKSKVLGPVAARKPLCQINESKPRKIGSVTKSKLIAGAAKKKLMSVRNKENTIQGELQCPRSMKSNTHITSVGRFLNSLGGRSQQKFDS